MNNRKPKKQLKRQPKQLKWSLKVMKKNEEEA